MLFTRYTAVQYPQLESASNGTCASPPQQWTSAWHVGAGALKTAPCRQAVVKTARDWPPQALQRGWLTDASLVPASSSET